MLYLYLAAADTQVNASLTREMFAKAQETGLFFCTGLWTRFFPATQMCALPDHEFGLCLCHD